MSAWEICVRDPWGNWQADMVGDDNRFATEAEAEAAIGTLKGLGGAWARATYKVRQVAP